MRILLCGPAAPSELARWLPAPAAPSLPRGLGGASVTTLAASMLDAGHEVELITLAPEVDEPITLRGERLSVFVGPYRSQPRARITDLFQQEREALGRLLSTASAPTISAHWTYEFAWAALRDGRPALITARDAPLTVLRLMPDAYRMARTAMAYRVRAGVRHLAAVSHYLAQRWRVEMGYRRPICILPNAIARPDTDNRPTPDSRRLDASQPGPVIVDVTDAGPLKNVRSLLRAFARIRTAHPLGALLLVGPGLDANGELASWAKDHGLNSRVEFVGPVSPQRVWQVLDHADLLVHPSREESFGRSLVEAMLSGIPVVAGACSGGVVQTLDSGRAGLLADVTDPEALAAAALSLLADPDRMQALAAAGLQHAERTYSPTAVVAQYTDQLTALAGAADAGVPPTGA